MDFLRRRSQDRLDPKPDPALERKKAVHQAAMDWVNKMIKDKFQVEGAQAFDRFNDNGKYRNEIDPEYFTPQRYWPPKGSTEERIFMERKVEAMQALGISPDQLKQKKPKFVHEESPVKFAVEKAVYETTVKDLEWVNGEVEINGAGERQTHGLRYLRINPDKVREVLTEDAKSQEAPPKYTVH